MLILNLRSMFTIGFKPYHIPILVIISIAFWLLSNEFLLLINHWKASSGKVLILSRGAEEFLYGIAGSPVAKTASITLRQE
jgi:hypothetical protein